MKSIITTGTKDSATTFLLGVFGLFFLALILMWFIYDR
jgi:hypothetical protein